MFGKKNPWLYFSVEHFCLTITAILLTLSQNKCSLQNIIQITTKIQDLWQIFLCFPSIIVHLLMADTLLDSLSN